MRWATFLWNCGLVWHSQLLFGWNQFASQASALGNFKPSHVIYWLFVYPYFYEGFLSGSLLWKKGLIYGRLLVFFILNASECYYCFFQVTLLDGVIIGPLSLCFILCRNIVFLYCPRVLFPPCDIAPYVLWAF